MLPTSEYDGRNKAWETLSSDATDLPQASSPKKRKKKREPTEQKNAVLFIAGPEVVQWKDLPPASLDVLSCIAIAVCGRL